MTENVRKEKRRCTYRDGAGKILDSPLGGAPVAHARWVLMAKKDISGDLGENYQLPYLIEAVTAIFAHFVSTGIQLFPIRPSSWGKCADIFGGAQTLLGGFTPPGMILETTTEGMLEVSGYHPAGLSVTTAEGIFTSFSSHCAVYRFPSG